MQVPAFCFKAGDMMHATDPLVLAVAKQAMAAEGLAAGTGPGEYEPPDGGGIVKSLLRNFIKCSAGAGPGDGDGIEQA